MKKLLFNENSMLSLSIQGCHRARPGAIAPHIMELL